MNADGQINDGLLGANLFAYCENNPVMRVDQTGRRPILGADLRTENAIERELSIAYNQSSNVAIQRCLNKIRAQSNTFSIKNFKNADGSYSLYDNLRNNPDSIFHEQILSGDFSPPAFSLKDGTVEIGSANLMFMTGGWEFGQINLSLLDVGNARLAALVNNKGVDISAIASIWAPSMSIEIWDFVITLSVNVGSIGGKINVGAGHIDIGAAYGYGASLSFDY